MSDAPDKKKRSIRRQRSIYQVHYDIKRQEEMTARPIARRAGSPDVTAYHQQVAGHRSSQDTKYLGKLCAYHKQRTVVRVTAYHHQVAGHKSSQDTKYLGLLQCSNGTILKPIIKEAQRREVEFYTRLVSAADPDLVELRRLVPRYFGTTLYSYGGHMQEYIMMEDLAQRMIEPCIMDVKIGRRTWDPLATEEKIKSEQSKYALCKQQYGFCIPGYQVHRLGARRAKYNKEHGKKLHGQAVKDAIKNYLNGMGRQLCRALVLQLLTQLWRVQTWSRHQTALKLYSASVLLIYDAARLRECCGDNDVIPRIECRPTSAPPRRRSIHSMHSPSSFSGQLTAKGPHYKKLNSVPVTPMTLAQTAFHPPHSTWNDAWEKLNHNHSFDHNYEDKLSKIKMNYRATLDQLSYDSPNPNPWGTVKIIDFAHAFFNDEEERAVDDNFREGIESLVGIFESFLRETNDQVI